MNKNYTLKELADIGLSAACQFEPNSKFPLSFQNYREAFVKAILDAIGYELPKNAEREAFDAWCKANHKLATTDQFEAWKAGREELRKGDCSDQCEDPKTEPEWWEPEWISWNGGDKSPIVEKQTRYEVEFREGSRHTLTRDVLDWSHNGSICDIVAYRILD